MHQLTYYYLILKYPTLREYINRCHLSNQTRDLFDLLIGLELEEGRPYV